jgi:hypothetical protein
VVGGWSPPDRIASRTRAAWGRARRAAFQKTNLILTSSTEATARTVDLFEIWDAELPFENVEVFRLERFSSRAGNTLHDPRLIKRE